MYIGLLTRGKKMSVRSSFQGEPVDLKAKIAGLHTLLNPRQVKRAYIAPAVVVHPGVRGIAVAQLLQYKKKRAMNDQVQLPPECQGGHLHTEEG